MRLLHTSDWHLGITLSERSRRDEMTAFLSFLRDTINTRSVDTLIISGDIYDTAVPSNEAQNIYYDFLSSLKDTCCRDVVVIAGNHDSPTMLSASAAVLRRLNIHVYSSVVNLEPLVLEDRGIILPIPFPRDSEIRRAQLSETIEEGQDRLKAAIAALYRDMYRKAEALKLNLPIIATGHLSVASASFDGEKNKELYLGGLGTVDTGIFDSGLSYVALGHIHKPQKLNGKGTIRYSGSPIAMTFDEAKYTKCVVIADCSYGEETVVETVEVPVERELITVRGDADTVKKEVRRLRDGKRKGWVSILLTSPEGSATIREEADGILSGSELEVLISRNTAEGERLREESGSVRELSSMTEEDVFDALLQDNACTGERRERMLSLFREVLRRIDGGDGDEN